MLCCLNARYYDPETSRFINADSTLSGGLNLFAYCYNNPVNMVDYEGLSGTLQIFAHEYHAWLAYTSDETGVTQTIGTWDGSGFGQRRGVNYNVEANGINSRGWYDGRVSLSAHIDDAQEKNLFDFIHKHDKWSLYFNCSTFAVSAWKAAGQQKISNKALGIIPTSTALAESIKKVTGYRLNAPVVPDLLP